MPLCQTANRLKDTQARITELVAQLNHQMPAVVGACLQGYVIKSQWFRDVTNHCVTMEEYASTLATIEEVQLLVTTADRMVV